jgi:hypothetical protein
MNIGKHSAHYRKRFFIRNEEFALLNKTHSLEHCYRRALDFGDVTLEAGLIPATRLKIYQQYTLSLVGQRAQKRLSHQASLPMPMSIAAIQPRVTIHFIPL